MRSFFVAYVGAILLIGLLAMLDGVKGQDAKPAQPTEILAPAIYEVQGVDVNNKPYVGIAIIKKREHDYLIQTTAGVGSNAVGFGVIEDGKLFCVWKQDGTDTLGMSIYKISADGKTLKGKWMPLGPPTPWTEETLRDPRPWPVAKINKGQDAQ